MFIVGRQYRVVPSSDARGSIEGTMIEVDGPMFALNVEGIYTVFHLASVAYVEMVDQVAEDARSKARADAWAKAMT